MIAPHKPLVYHNHHSSTPIFQSYLVNISEYLNDILLYLDGMGETFAINVNQVSSISNYFKFSAAPQYDSLQFKISGRITEKENFVKTTALIVLP